jgi:polysaccharide biosynthesis protein PslJ
VARTSGREWVPFVPRFANQDIAQRMSWGVGLVLTAVAAAISLLGLPEVGVLLILVTVTAMLFVLTDRDATTILTLFAVLLMLVPSRFVVGPLGAIGTPGALIGLGALIWWLASRLHPEVGGDHGQQPLRPAVLAFTWWLMLSYAFAQLRQLDPVEASSADRRTIGFIALAGIALLAMDGIPNRDRLDKLLRRLIALGGIVAILGLLQFFGLDLVGQVRLPGLTLNRELSTIVGFRGGLPRVTATTVHAIEFAIIMALLLPLAMHYAFYGKERRWASWLWLSAILLALPVSVSRSSIVGVLVGVPVLMLAWSWKRRLGFVLFTIGALGILGNIVQGLFQTLLELFQNVDENYSIQARVSDYEVIYQYVLERPIIGLGTGTFEPTVYRWIDNQWLGIVVTTGLVGVLLLLAIFVVAVSCARGVVRRSEDAATRHLAQALMATTATFAITFALFDAFAFAMNAGLFYLTIGLVGALWRVETGSSYASRDRRGRLVRTWTQTPAPPGPAGIHR